MVKMPGARPPATPALMVNREKVLAFRLQSHSLVQRLPAGSVLRAASACGMQDTPPGSAALGVRLLPPHDPYLAQRDRSTLVPDLRLQRRIWRSRGNPGVVLSGGQLVATWRPKKMGQRLALRVVPVSPIPRPVLAKIEEEAESLAIYRGCSSAQVELVEAD